MATPQRDVDSNVRPDEDIVEDIWAAVWQEDTIRASEIGSFSVTVQQGAVVLSGHLANEMNRSRIEACARAVAGVTAVRNHLIIDRQLEAQVAQALAEDARTQSHVIPVGSFHGWIRLSGQVPSRDVQIAAEELAGAVPQVRGVTALPRVPGEGTHPARRAVQPRLGAIVYGDHGQAGVVAQVVINPRNRLVTHVVVRANELLDEKRGPGDYLVPIEAFDIVNLESLFLARGGSASAAYSLFEPADYPPAPGGWQPPYPYAVGAVRWAAGRPEPVANWPIPQLQPNRPMADIPAARRQSGA